MGLFDIDFKRYDGFTGSIPQKFFDSKLPKCPMCGTTEPYWTLKSKMGMTANRNLAKCDKCGAILSATVSETAGMDKTIITTTGLLKAISGKKNKITYVKVEDVGSAQVTKIHEDKEYPLEELQEMANNI